ncbi:site-specific recombinase, resolvase family protein [Oceanococcus atlanticus]|uniref:Site-specific recombinase, resolvase family protein n=1 Tax=Oceanococcus atlanticus TaxID=1317117 RepID=A0A1Y1SJS1_9GAMM|nr:hypothetical protein [Oceanococcus atlanticus]ORE89449.1 site-specific recombinase, resolvase family protein [Oceanococcus atlanticus]
MKFGERMGLVEVSTTIQTSGMTSALRNSLWNVLDVCVWGSNDFDKGWQISENPYVDKFSTNLWFHFFKERLDSRSKYCVQILDVLRDWFFRGTWIDVYDFVEFVISYEEDSELDGLINQVLERELAGFRLINRQFVPITDELEKEAIEAALAPGPFEAARTHFRQALNLLADRENPDFRNSIKESISAVESVACELSGKPKATLGDALKVLEKEGQLHSALKSGFSSIYGYTSDADGIRHKLQEETKVDANDAKYFLVACTAFVNYLKSKHAAAT